MIRFLGFVFNISFLLLFGFCFWFYLCTFHHIIYKVIYYLVIFTFITMHECIHVSLVRILIAMFLVYELNKKSEITEITDEERICKSFSQLFFFFL